MQPRLFSKRQKMTAELLTGRTGEADHIVPYSKGGKTDMSNIQIISQRANRVKGNSVFEPRPWQANFSKAWSTRKEGEPFLLVAVPGGGKTLATLSVARDWLNAGTDRKLVIVVPSKNLQDQWQNEALKVFGIHLQQDIYKSHESDYHGCLPTYQWLSQNVEAFRYTVSKRPTMVIFDEIHHAGDESSYGAAILAAFEHAKERLLLSGTPWKTDGTAIPYVKYDSEGFAIPDFTYGLPDALAENVVRHLDFEFDKGELTNLSNGETYEFNGTIGETEAEKRLSGMLSPGGEYVREMIRKAHSKLLEYKQTQSDAAAIAICKDQYHATAISQVIEQITGEKPSVVVSDPTKCNDSIDQFRDSRKNWLVTVKMVSEGVDIKRLQVLCYLSNVTTDLYIRQVLGRISRVRNEGDYGAYSIMPADPRLIAITENLKSLQIQALQLMAENELPRNEIDSIESDERERPLLFFDTSHRGTDSLYIGTEQVNMLEFDTATEIANKYSIPKPIALQMVRDGAVSVSGTNELNINKPVIPKEKERKLLSKEVDVWAKQLAPLWIKKGLYSDFPSAIKAVHVKLSSVKQDKASISDLKRKLEAIKAEIAKC